jgi:hypothetical protein
MLGGIGHRADIFGFIKVGAAMLFANRQQNHDKWDGKIYIAPLTGARQEWLLGHGGVARLPESAHRQGVRAALQASSRFALTRTFRVPDDNN